MDEAAFNSDLWLIGAAVIGAGMGLERFDYARHQRIAFRWVMLGMAAIVAVAQAESLRGFLYLLAMPVGCYKIAKVVAQPIGAWWGRRHS